MKKILLAFFFCALVYSCKETGATGYETLDNQTFAQKLNDSNVVVLDVRTPDEYRQGHMPHAILMNYYDDGFRENIQNLDKDKTYLVYCAAGGRSSKTSKILKEHGFNNVFSLEHGFKKWNGPVEK
jgi:phage shock protein E